MEEQLSEKEKMCQKMESKAIKYKELSETLQQTISEHLKAEEELQNKLKSESKANAGK